MGARPERLPARRGLGGLEWRSPRRLAAGVAATVSLVVAANQAALAESGAGRSGPAEPVAVESWSAPDECPGPDQFTAAVRAHLGDNQTAIATVSVAIETTGGGYRLKLRTRVGDGVTAGVRELAAPTCDELVATAAVITALALDPLAGFGDDTAADDDAGDATPATGGQVDDDETPGPATLPEREPIGAEAEAPPTPSAPFRLSPAAAIGIVTDTGTLPGSSLGVGVGAAVLFAKWRIEGGVETWLTERATVEGDSDVGGEIKLWSGKLDLCYLIVDAGLALSACGGAHGGRMSAVGFGVVDPWRRRHWLLGGRAGVMATLPIASWVRLRGDLAGLVHVLRPDYQVEMTDRPLYRTALLAARAQLSVELVIP